LVQKLRELLVYNVLAVSCERAVVVFTAEWQYGIDECQSGGPRKGHQDPIAGRSQSGYPKRGTTLLGSSYLFTFGN